MDGQSVNLGPLRSCLWPHRVAFRLFILFYFIFRLAQVGDTMTTDEANEAAMHVALNLLTTLKNELGDLDRIKKVVKLVGFVNCVDGFDQQPAVINGYVFCVCFVWGLG